MRMFPWLVYGVWGVLRCRPGWVGLSKNVNYYIKSRQVCLGFVLMSRRVNRGYLVLFLLVGSVLVFSFPFAGAASFDGTYNYAYNLNGPNGWETHRVDRGFIVRNGQISSNPAAFSGTVDSSGNVRFSGPSPYGSPSATFTGSIGSDGRGEGSYMDSQGLGWWRVQFPGDRGGDAEFPLHFLVHR